MKLYSVIFKDHGKKYHFLGENNYEINSNVIVETENGLQYGKIIECLDGKIDESKYKKIIKIANLEDKEYYLELLKENKLALEKCRELVKKLELNMTVISADFNFDKTQLLFGFLADERIDFRELAKKLASIYHTRIELRQIGVRDKAKKVGGVGVCGQTICCSRFLNHIDTISMNMAKNQNLALNPSKINGLCGRLLCCLQYEDENYLECSQGMPSIGDVIKTKNGEGEVVSVDILNRKCKGLVGSNKEEVEIDNNEQ